ncbi:hypothetical protein NC652_029714 [Populus alba x Populus x berolinensis]|nr:hypothetical protein NC652_029714 [Populus alba x Populus x berolinensis]
MEKGLVTLVLVLVEDRGLGGYPPVILLLLFAVLGGRIRLLCCSCLLLLTVLSPHSRLQQEIMMGRESCFDELVTTLLLKVTVQRLKLLKLVVLKTQC